MITKKIRFSYSHLIFDDLSQSVSGRLTANNNGFYFDYKDGEYGFNTSANRGADTFSPFNKKIKYLVQYFRLNSNADRHFLFDAINHTVISSSYAGYGDVIDNYFINIPKAINSSANNTITFKANCIVYGIYNDTTYSGQIITANTKWYPRNNLTTGLTIWPA